MFRRFKKNNEELKNCNEALINSSGEPVLRVVLGDLKIATLFFDGEKYGLIYSEDFNKVGIAAFNPEQVANNEKPQINHCYYSDRLWHSFESRIPSRERPDFAALMRKHNLTGDENPLVILSKIGSISISKPWRLEVVPGKAS